MSDLVGGQPFGQASPDVRVNRTFQTGARGERDLDQTPRPRIKRPGIGAALAEFGIALPDFGMSPCKFAGAGRQVGWFCDFPGHEFFPNPDRRKSAAAPKSLFIKGFKSYTKMDLSVNNDYASG